MGRIVDINADKASTKSSTTTKRQRPPVDWEAVKREFTTGRYTYTELSARHGVDRAAICRKGKRESWKQDLSSAVRRATRNKLIEAAVGAREKDIDEKVNAATTYAVNAALKAVTLSTELVAVAAETNKQVVLGHRKDLREARAVAGRLLEELKGLTSDSSGLTVRVGILKSLSEALAKLHASERIAFGLDERDDPPEDPKELVPSLSMAREVAYALGKGHELVRQAKSQTQIPEPRQAAS